MNTVNICLSCDNNYAQFAGVVITSILKNAEGEKIKFFLLDGGIEENNKRKVLELKNIKDCEINFIIINEKDFDDYKQVKTHSYITLATYYRLKIASILKNIDRIIYLDCDIVVNSSLYELFNVELTTECFAGVNDINKNQIKENPTYINGGVLVMDLKNMREQNLEEKFLLYTKENIDKITCGDQEIINEVCKGNIKIVDDKYNVQISDFMNRSCFTKNPVIIHYIAKNKPWKNISLCYYKEYYLKYLQLTPWKKNKKEVFYYSYVKQILSIFKFILHRPTFFLQKKFYHAFINTYLR